MNKKSDQSIKFMDLISFGPVVLLPVFFWSLVQMQRFDEWYLILIPGAISGAIMGVLSARLINIYKPGILKTKSEKGFRLIHITITMGILLCIFLVTLSNKTLIISTQSIEHQIVATGERGTGKNRTHYVEIINSDNQREKLNFGKGFIETLKNKEIVTLAQKKSIWGLTFHEIP